MPPASAMASVRRIGYRGIVNRADCATPCPTIENNRRSEFNSVTVTEGSLRIFGERILTISRSNSTSVNPSAITMPTSGIERRPDSVTTNWFS